VERNNAKQITSLGIFPVDYTVRHKSHIEKIMIICTTGIIPYEGDIMKGGIGVKVLFSRVGCMTEAKQDSHAREYHDDGRYTMTGEQLRKKGELYWENWEVTGSDEEREGVKKFALLRYFRDELIPALEDKARRYNVIIRFQWDGAGPHNDSRLLRFIQAEFNKRGWIFDFQPSQCPILNVSDACIFPSLSKKVSSNQAVQFDGTRKILRGEAIWDAAKDAYAAMPESTIARAYTGHAQIATAVIEHGGDISAFTRGAGALHYGIRKTYVTTTDGVVMLEDATPTELDPKHLKYLRPRTEDLGGEEAIYRLNVDQQMALGVVTTLALVKR